jgi:hypothetical protein
MQAHCWSAALGFALLVGPVWAADLPKEGTVTATWSGAGTIPAILAFAGVILAPVFGAIARLAIRSGSTQPPADWTNELDSLTFHQPDYRVVLHLKLPALRWM